MRLPGILACVLLVAGVFGCSGNREMVRREAQASYKRGVAFLREGRPSQALQELAKAEALTPDDPEILYMAGAAYWMKREYGPAEARFRKATELKPDYPEAWNDLGALYMDQGRYSDAIAPLERAVNNVFYGTRERALANLGWALYKSGRAAEAEKRLRQAVEAAPAFPLPYKFLGIVLQERDENREAAARFAEALRLYPDDSETHLRMGMSLFKLGDKVRARAAFETAWRLAPGTDVGKSAKDYMELLQ
jgi:Tfp pilus assembly protein PilF